nr:hydroxymethylbilane synthase [Ardenticatena sp.]
MKHLRVGTRGSLLARTQTAHVVALLQAAHPTLEVETVVVQTSGDRSTASLRQIGGQGVFTRELEAALLDGRIDVAVHSLKDLPSTMPDGLVLAAVPPREDVRDVLVSRFDGGLDALPKGARVGTGSLRRQAQLLAMRPDLHIADIRGNVDTRLRKLAEGQYDAILLAAAGLARLGWLDRATAFLPVDLILPAPAQAALGVQCRADDDQTRALLAAIDHAPTHVAVRAERAVLQRLGAGCRLPVAAYAEATADMVTIRTRVVGIEGYPVLEEVRSGRWADAEQLGMEAAEALLSQGAGALLVV